MGTNVAAVPYAASPPYSAYRWFVTGVAPDRAGAERPA